MKTLNLPEQIYFAAPFETPEQKAFNHRIVRLIRTYNFPTVFPQEKWEDGINHEAFQAYCIDELNRSHLVLAVCYGDVFDARTAFEVGYAIGRRHTVLGLRNNPLPKTQPGEWNGHPPLLARESCARVIEALEKDEDLLNPLISILNRYYGSYQSTLLS